MKRTTREQKRERESSIYLKKLTNDLFCDKIFWINERFPSSQASINLSPNEIDDIATNYEWKEIEWNKSRFEYQNERERERERESVCVCVLRIEFKWNDWIMNKKWTMKCVSFSSSNTCFSSDWLNDIFQMKRIFLFNSFIVRLLFFNQSINKRYQSHFHFSISTHLSHSFRFFLIFHKYIINSW
jgi:hypothetical protein